MDDNRIIELYHRRDEQAIAESESKYGPQCRRIALNILTIPEDAEECVNDTWHAAWNRMPPNWPGSLGAFLGRITRNLSISRFRANRAKKRYSALEVLLSELDDCVPAQTGVEQEIDRRELTGLIDRWLDSLEEDERTLFVRRYWYGDALRDLADECGCTPNRLAQRMLRLRRNLSAFLEAEGVTL